MSFFWQWRVRRLKDKITLLETLLVRYRKHAALPDGQLLMCVKSANQKYKTKLEKVERRIN